METNLRLDMVGVREVERSPFNFNEDDGVIKAAAASVSKSQVQVAEPF